MRFVALSCRERDARMEVRGREILWVTPVQIRFGQEVVIAPSP
jgi:hypothetical protein